MSSQAALEKCALDCSEPWVAGVQCAIMRHIASQSSEIDRCPREVHDRHIREQAYYVTLQTGGRPMPIANIRGVHINFQVLGAHGPWVALSPGGRRDLSGVMPLATQVAAAGYRVLLHDRRNCGASDVVIEGDESEYESGPMTSTPCSPSSRLCQPTSAAAPRAAGCRCCSPCVIRRPFGPSSYGGSLVVPSRRSAWRTTTMASSLRRRSRVACRRSARRSSSGSASPAIPPIGTDFWA